MQTKKFILVPSHVLSRIYYAIQKEIIGALILGILSGFRLSS